jgi:lysyl-tRNA synthetase class 2
MEERLNKLKKLNELRINPYPYRFDRTHTFAEIRAKFEELASAQSAVRTAGRIITIRGHGKTIFATLNDEQEKIQIYLRQQDLGETFTLFDNFDIGDFIGVEGKVFKTKTGEMTIFVEKFVLLSKALRPLPEKWHGLKDIEIRYRKRYLDLISNAEVRGIFKRRSQLIALLRDFFNHQGFLEVETPVLQPIYGGAAARPFKTFYNALDQEMYLRIADELYLKRLIVGGYEKVWELCKDFRNEGLDRFHNPEFSMIEAYQAYTDYFGIMELVENLIAYLVKNLFSDNHITFQEKVIEVVRPFKRVKYVESLNDRLGVDILKVSGKELDSLCERNGIKIDNQSIGYKIDKLFSELVQKSLIEPTFVMDYPKIISPLAKEHRDNPRLVERFELIMFGLEVANAFSELNDPIEQRKRFEEQLAHKEEGIGEIDEDFLEALEYGMPPTGGLGIGVDRLCMILLNQPSIRDVILFPQMRKEDAR